MDRARQLLVERLNTFLRGHMDRLAIEAGVTACLVLFDRARGSTPSQRWSGDLRGGGLERHGR